MALKDFFTEIIAKINSIEVNNPVAVPIANNLKKTPSNVNKVFKYYNIWDEQIDEEVKGNNYSFQCPAVFIEYIAGDCKMLLNNVSSYPDSVITFHIFSMLLDGQQDNMEQNLDIYDKRDLLKSKLGGFSPSHASTFMCCKDVLDYKHKNITKYLLSYNFNYIDNAGSIYDNNSAIGLIFQTLLNPTLGINIFYEWISGKQYDANISVVSYREKDNEDFETYLCIMSNHDDVFNLSNWQLCTQWQSKISYSVNNYVYYLGFVYKCTTENSDEIFNNSNWQQITN